ncbi:MAG TPA: uridine kinase [Thermoanaerobaculia bacterium]
MKSGPVIVGIAGGTGSGKTTVARSIYDRVGSGRIEWISHDSYYRDFAHLTHDDRARINFDHPDSLESELLVAHLERLMRGEIVEIPIYDFTTHRRKSETQRVEPKRVIIVEGILVLAEPEIRRRIDIKLFVDTPPDIRLLRRLQRDIDVRGRSVESVLRQYLTSVRPMHEEFVEPSKRHADLIIPEGGENQVALDAIISRVEHLLAA